MIKAVIVEDEKNSQELLRDLITEYCDGIEVAGIAGNVAEGLEAIRTHQPGLLFLDIELPDGDGFQVLEKTEKLNFDVIFTTAYDQYAIQAFKQNSIDYLLKPIDIQELKQAINKFIEYKTHHKSDQINILRDQINNTNKRLAVPVLNGYEFVAFNEIIRLQADGSYTILYQETEKARKS